jgi:hypothetical protein
LTSAAIEIATGEDLFTGHDLKGQDYANRVALTVGGIIGGSYGARFGAAIGESVRELAGLLSRVGNVAGVGIGGGVSPSVPKITSGSQVTEQTIRDAMKGAELQSQQAGGVSLRLVQQYVNKLLNGEVAPAIKVDGQLIVEGNHRYIAGRIVGQPPAVQQWSGGRGPAISWDQIKISTDW